MTQVIAIAPTQNAAQSPDFTVSTGTASIMAYTTDAANPVSVGQLMLLRKIGAAYYPMDTLIDGGNRNIALSGAGTYAVKKGVTPFPVGVAVDTEASSGGGGPVTSDDITDATAVGKAVLTAADAAAARTAIGAGIVKPPTAGLADTATKLATARTIGGVAFDGTGNISPSLTGIAVTAVPGYNVTGTFNLQLINGVLTFVAAT
jgi:hypothetical protein